MAWDDLQPGTGLLDALARELMPVVTGLGFKVVDLSHLKSQGSTFVRLLIHKAEGVTADDCAMVGRAVQQSMQLIPGLGEPSLEISSPGIRREFRHRAEFDIFAGTRAALLVHGDREWQIGTLRGTREDEVVLEIEGRETTLNLAQIRRARLQPQEP